VDVEIVISCRKQPLDLDADQFAGPVCGCATNSQREGVAGESFLAEILAAN